MLNVTKDRVLVQDVTGSVWIDASAPLPVVGSWIIAQGEWNGERIEGGKCQLLNVPRTTFPRVDGDWRWFQDHEQKRASLLRDRAKVVRTAREFFDQRAFVEVETPLAVPSPGLEVHLDAMEVIGGGAARWLITSPEYQMKRLLAGGLPRIYQICRCFRQAEDGAFHQPEFSMLEWYRAFAGVQEIMRDTEELVAHVAAALRDGSTIIPGCSAPVDVAPPWERLTVSDAFQRYAGVPVEHVVHDEEKFFRLFVEKVEPELGRHRPTFLTSWPAPMASLARLDPKNPAVAERAEAYVDGVELCNGFSELIDPLEQVDRLERDQRKRAALDKAVYPIDRRFVEALEEGLPPSGGNALGVDRLVMLVLGVRHIEDVVAFSYRRL